MPRRRKVAVVVEENSDPDSESVTRTRAAPKTALVPQSRNDKSALVGRKKQMKTKNLTMPSIQEQTAKLSPMFELFDKAQANESLHGKYIKELLHLYDTMQQADFMHHFLRGFRIYMRFDETNHYANTGLSFMAKFVTTLGAEDDETHPVLSDTFDYVLSTISSQKNVRFRLVQFVNFILGAMQAEAALDESICTQIMKYMTDRLRDYTASVRVQAVQALQRLQVPENPDDAIVRLYMYHMANDTSAKVRQAAITAIGRNAYTISSILERLWDIDERVRRHTYLQMSNYPVKSYKVVQRIIFLEQGLNDHSDAVRKVVTSVLLPQWLQSYNRGYISFVSALKIDANDEEVKRFMTIAKQALTEIFKSSKSIDELIDALPLSTEGEFEKCIDFSQLSVEVAVYWLALVEYLQNSDDEDDRIHDVICDLSTFCNYVNEFCKYMSNTTDLDRWTIQENQYKFLILVDILLAFDLGDEIGRQNLKLLISNVLMTQIVGECIVSKLVKCVENMLPEQEVRLQYFVDITRSVIDPTGSIDFSDKAVAALIDSIKDPNAKVKISSLKFKILDLREQESNAQIEKNYAQVEKIAEDLVACNEDLVRMLNKFTSTNQTTDGAPDANAELLATFQPKKLSLEAIQQCLQICFFAVASKHTRSLTPNMCKLYQDFIRRQMESKQMVIRDWALKCGTSFSMLYEQLAKDVYNELHLQFFRHQTTRIWITSISATFELIDRYGFDYFETDTVTVGGKHSDKSKKTYRQLYNKMDGYMDDPDEEESNKSSIELMYLFGHLLETVTEVSIIKALIIGFCRIVLSGHYTSEDLVSKLLLRYFNPATDTEINQILGIFFEALINRRRQECLQKALMHTLFLILDAPNDTPLQEIKPETILKFVINSTMPAYCASGVNLHNEIAASFLKVMCEHATNKELLKSLSKELLTLQIGSDPKLRNELKVAAEPLLEKALDSKIEASIKQFQQMMDGTYKAPECCQNTVMGATDDPRDEDDIPTEDELEDNGSTADDRGTPDTGIVSLAANDLHDETEGGISSIFASDSQTLQSHSISSIFPPSQPEQVITSTQEEGRRLSRGKKSGDGKVVEDTAVSKKQLSRGRPADSPETEQMAATSKVRRMATGKKVIRCNNNKSKGSTSKPDSGSTQPEDNEKDGTSDASKENILDDSAEISSIGAEDTIPRSPDAPTIQQIRMKKYTTKDLIQSPKPSLITPILSEQSPEPHKEVTPKVKRKLVESNVMVRLKKMSRQSIERQTGTKQTPNMNAGLYRTRNALVAEFKNSNVMTRNRQAVDHIKSPTRRVEHLKRVATILNRTDISLLSPVSPVNPRRKSLPTRLEMASAAAIAPRSPATPASGRGTPNTTPKSTPNVSPTRPSEARSTARSYSRASLISSTPAVSRSPSKRQPTHTVNTVLTEPRHNTRNQTVASSGGVNRKQPVKKNAKQTNNNNISRTPVQPAARVATRGRTLNNSTASTPATDSKNAAAWTTLNRRNNSSTSISSEDSIITRKSTTSVASTSSSTTTRSSRSSDAKQQTASHRNTIASNRPAQAKPVNSNSNTNQRLANATAKKSATPTSTSIARSTRTAIETTTTRKSAEVRTSSRTRTPIRK